MNSELKCDACNWRGQESDLIQENMSMLYRDEDKTFRTFVKMSCPKCKDVFTILMATSEVVGDTLKTI